jgi:predicted nucleotide-binding protein (sugar kinase/HSP70/actin superfamily)
MGTFSEYLYAAGEPSHDISAFIKDSLTRVIISVLADWLYGRVRREHPWLLRQDITKVRDAAETLLPGRYPTGEAPATLGTVLHHWDEEACDGVVIISPWGCGPALVTEGLLRHRRDTPVLYLYSDGSPIDDRRLDAFAFRLRQGALAGR